VKTVAASWKSTPCFSRFGAALSGSQVIRTASVYVRCQVPQLWRRRSEGSGTSHNGLTVSFLGERDNFLGDGSHLIPRSRGGVDQPPLILLTSTTPSAPIKDASRYSIDVASTPPQLRRGVSIRSLRDIRFKNGFILNSSSSGDLNLGHRWRS
jgi:hypothetical protein